MEGNQRENKSFEILDYPGRINDCLIHSDCGLISRQAAVRNQDPGVLPRDPTRFLYRPSHPLNPTVISTIRAMICTPSIDNGVRSYLAS